MVLDACAVAGMILLSILLAAIPCAIAFICYRARWFCDEIGPALVLGLVVSTALYAWALCRAGM